MKVFNCFSQFDSVQKWHTSFLIYILIIDMQIDWYAKGQQLQKEGNYPAAIKAYQEAIRENYHNSKAFKSIIEVLGHLQNYQMALQICQQLIKISPTDPEAYYMKGVCLDQLGKNACLEAYQKATKLNPDYFAAYVNMSSTLMKNQQYTASIFCGKQMMRIQPDYQYSYLLMGQAYKQLGKYEESINILNKGINLKPTPFLFLKLGQVRNFNQEYQASVEAYKQAIKINPDYFEAYFNMALSLIKLGDYEAVIEAEKQVIRIKPDYYEAYYNMGSAFCELGDQEAALKAFQQCLHYNPNNARVYRRLGELYQKQKDYKSAVHALQQLINLQPKDPQAYFKLGVNYQLQNNIDEALLAYQLAVKLDSDNYYYYYNLGFCYIQRKNFQSGIEAMKQAIRINPDDYKANAILGICLYQLQDYNSAMELYQKLVEKYPDRSQAFFILGDCLQIHGDSSDSVLAYQKAIKLKPDFHEAYNNMGIRLIKLGRRQQAEKCFIQAIKIKPQPLYHLNLSAIYMRTETKYKELKQIFSLIKNFKEEHKRANKYGQEQMKSITFLLNKLQRFIFLKQQNKDQLNQDQFQSLTQLYSQNIQFYSTKFGKKLITHELCGMITQVQKQNQSLKKEMNQRFARLQNRVLKLEISMQQMNQLLEHQTTFMELLKNLKNQQKLKLFDFCQTLAWILPCIAKTYRQVGVGLRDSASVKTKTGTFLEIISKALNFFKLIPLCSEICQIIIYACEIITNLYTKALIEVICQNISILYTDRLLTKDILKAIILISEDAEMNQDIELEVIDWSTPIMSAIGELKDKILQLVADTKSGNINQKAIQYAFLITLEIVQIKQNQIPYQTAVTKLIEKAHQEKTPVVQKQTCCQIC